MGCTNRSLAPGIVAVMIAAAILGGVARPFLAQASPPMTAQEKANVKVMMRVGRGGREDELQLFLLISPYITSLKLGAAPGGSLPCASRCGTFSPTAFLISSTDLPCADMVLTLFHLS
jgi:hypothetical protein